MHVTCTDVLMNAVFYGWSLALQENGSILGYKLTNFYLLHWAFSTVKDITI